MWQVRFVNYFVKQFKNSDSILAWEPGNECNCMGSANRHQAWVWMSSITHAIRATDSTRP
jgi:endo-1,4-beta-mannosidase